MGGSALIARFPSDSDGREIAGSGVGCSSDLQDGQ